MCGGGGRNGLLMLSWRACASSCTLCTLLRPVQAASAKACILLFLSSSSLVVIGNTFMLNCSQDKSPTSPACSYACLFPRQPPPPITQHINLVPTMTASSISLTVCLPSCLLPIPPTARQPSSHHDIVGVPVVLRGSGAARQHQRRQEAQTHTGRAQHDGTGTR